MIAGVQLSHTYAFCLQAKKQALERAQRDADYNPAADPDFQESMVLDTQTARARGVPQYVPSGKPPPRAALSNA